MSEAATLPGSIDVEPVELTLLREQLDHASAPPTASEQIAWFEPLRRAGLTETSLGSLFQSIALRTGFSRQWRALHGSIDSGRHAPKHLDQPSNARLTTELAADELSEFARRHPGTLRAAIAANKESDVSLGSPHAPVLPSARSAVRVDEALGLIDDLYLFLSSTELARDPVERDLVQRLEAVGRLQLLVDPRRFAYAPRGALIGALIATNLREFALETSDLVGGSLGSASLLHAAACFDQAGLGPYFGNVGRIARRSRDVFELARLAERVSAERGESVDFESWIVLLSRELDGPLWLEVLDDLGDIGALRALDLICERAARLPADRTDRATIVRIRDSAIDNDCPELAARAQKLIVRMAPEHLHEGVILGTLHAMAGQLFAAQDVFKDILLVAPGYADVAERLRALHTGEFEPFIIPAGYETPIDRRLARAHRGDVLPVRPNMLGERIDAVHI